MLQNNSFLVSEKWKIVVQELLYASSKMDVECSSQKKINCKIKGPKSTEGKSTEIEQKLDSV